MTSSPDTPGPIATIPAFVTITDITQPDARAPEYVISNEATGRYFLANGATVQFFDGLRQTGSVVQALAMAGIAPEHGRALMQQLSDHGVVIQAGQTQAKEHAARGPVEGKLISVRWDLLDAASLTHRLRGVGRFVYSPFGYGVWLVAMAVMGYTLLVHREKAALTLMQVFEASLAQWLLFAALFVALKAVHEFGHALAYQEMCRQEGVSAGPIRMGLCIFALSPFPYTDVTGAWRLRNRYRRVMIGAGGIYLETWIMAALTVFWAQTQTGLLQTVVLQVAIVAGGMALLFNLNPAVKLDGYFMLTDYLRRPNLAARASVAARSVFARWFGASVAPPNRADLLYWTISYAYRWTIFAGIFWIAYQFDTRLAPLVLVIVVMLLLVRPLIASVRFAFKQGIRPMKTGIALCTLAAAGAALLVPLPYWHTTPAQFIRFDTRFVEPTENGQVNVQQDGRLHFYTPDLDQQIADVGLRVDMLRNLRVAQYASAEEQARLGEQIAQFEAARDSLKVRRADLVPVPGPDAVWTALDSRYLQGAWVVPGRQIQLAAVSAAVAPYLELRLDQAILERNVALSDGVRLAARPVHAPDCTFAATLEMPQSAPVAINGIISVRARPVGDLNGTCAKGLAHGAALVAKLGAPDRSLFGRARLAAARALQNRLPIDIVGP